MPTPQIGTVTGLNTFVYSAPDTGPYIVSGTLQLPNAVSLGSNIASGVITTVKRNSSTVYTSAPGQRGFAVIVPASAGDILQVILSSSVAQDQVINSVQATICVSEGGVL